MTQETRLEKLKAMESARTNAEGKPIKGYGKNVLAVRAEIARLERPVDKPADPA